MLIDTQQWLHESAEAERDAALAEELRLQQRAYDRKVAEIAAQWEGRLAEVSASRDDAQASVEFLRERARQLEALLLDPPSKSCRRTSIRPEFGGPGTDPWRVRRGSGEGPAACRTLV